MRVLLGQLIDKAYKDLLKAEHIWDAVGRSRLRNRDVAAVRYISGTFDRLRWPSTLSLMTVVIDNKQKNLGASTSCNTWNNASHASYLAFFLKFNLHHPSFRLDAQLCWIHICVFVNSLSFRGYNCHSITSAETEYISFCEMKHCRFYAKLNWLDDWTSRRSQHPFLVSWLMAVILFNFSGSNGFPHSFLYLLPLLLRFLCFTLRFSLLLPLLWC